MADEEKKTLMTKSDREKAEKEKKLAQAKVQDEEEDFEDEEGEGEENDTIYYNRRMGDMQATAGAWMVSFTDVMALMLTFFVMLFAMSHPKEETWEEFSTAVNKEFNKFYGKPLNRGHVDKISIAKIDRNQALDLNYLQAILSGILDEESMLQDVQLIMQQNSLVISFPDSLLFNAGNAALKDSGSKAIYAIGATLMRIRNRIEVSGHADPRPVSVKSRYNSNWELSLARALSVAAALENVGYRKSILVRGHSSGRYTDLPDYIAESQRLDLARRVDVVIMEDDGNKPLSLGSLTF